VTCRESVLLAIQGGSVTVTAISIKLHDLGVRWKCYENEVRARLSELRHLGLVTQDWNGGQWHLTDSGEHALAEITPHLYVDELSAFSQ
jgi:hypothetical protein